MNTIGRHAAATALSLLAAASSPLLHATENGHGRTFNVTITNLTRGLSFTPILVASHRPEAQLLFNAGDPASSELAMLAEGGDTAPLNAVLEANEGTHDTTTSAGLLDPGASVTVQITGRPGLDHISMAAMLLPTNDGFFAFQNVELPRGRASETGYSPAFDAGSEPNDELCISIPGPVCGGEGGSPDAGGEGYVHVHAGIHGIGDLNTAQYDWRNPVARVVIRRAH